MKTTVDLPDALFRRAKATAAERGMSLKSFITRAVEQSLAAPRGGWGSALAGLPQVPGETLETVRRSIEGSDAADLSLQKDK
jgi:hypothetical protein